MPGGAVGRRGDHLAAGRILLVDRERPEIDPVDHGQRILQRPLGPLGQQPVERRRAALDVEPAGQDAARRHAAVDAGRHRGGDRVEPRVDLLVGKAGALVGAGDVGDAQPSRAAMASNWSAEL